MAPTATIPNLVKYAQANGGRLHATITARIQGMPDNTYLLTHPEGLTDPGDLALALRLALDTLEPNAALEVPTYAEVLADRIEAIQVHLGRMGADRSTGLEREADALGRALGAVLARTYLEQRRERA